MGNRINGPQKNQSRTNGHQVKWSRKKKPQTNELLTSIQAKNIKKKQAHIVFETIAIKLRVEVYSRFVTDAAIFVFEVM